MAKINRKARRFGLFSRSDRTVNYEGGVAFAMTPKMELYTRVATALVGEPKFYEPNAEGDRPMLQLIGAVSKEDPEFILKLAVHCRRDLHLRTVPVVLLVEACRYESKRFVRRYAPHIVQRPDELTEAIAYWKRLFGDIGDQAQKGMLSNPLKRGLADAFENFDAYQLAKYDRDGEVKLKDVLKIVHPKPKTPERSEIYRLLRERELPVPETWETYISVHGSTKENWQRILPKMGYMAKLRNLRNFLDKGVDLEPVLEHLTNRKAVRNSKQFPFRFFSAYRELENHPSPETPAVLEALETALEVSVENVPEFKGTTLLSADNSGSMQAPVSARSKVKRSEVADLLQAIANEICDKAITSVFAQSFKVVHTIKSAGILANTRRFLETNVGMATNAFLAIRYLNKERIHVDRILLFSDMQCYDTRDPGRYLGWPQGASLAEELKKYKASVNPEVYLYSLDLAGYGTAQFPKDEARVCMIAGWSERLLNFIPLYESLGTGGLEAIDKIRLEELDETMKRAREEEPFEE